VKRDGNLGIADGVLQYCNFSFVVGKPGRLAKMAEIDQAVSGRPSFRETGSGCGFLISGFLISDSSGSDFGFQGSSGLM